MPRKRLTPLEIRLASALNTLSVARRMLRQHGLTDARWDLAEKQAAEELEDLWCSSLPLFQAFDPTNNTRHLKLSTQEFTDFKSEHGLKTPGNK